MRKTLFAVAIMALLVAGVASSATAAIPELRPIAGAFIPTGAQRDILQDAFLIGAQGGVEVAETMHFIGMFAWSPRNSSEDASIYQYDVGLETFRPLAMGSDWEMRPFLGVGVGGRTYADGANNNHQETNLAGYGALGTEFQLDRLALRIEGRDYISRFEGLQGNRSAETRNDISVMTGLSIHW